MRSGTGSSRTPALAALRHRDFAFFWSAALISSSANWMQQFTVPYIMWEMTASNTWVGAAAFTSLIPRGGPDPPLQVCWPTGTRARRC